MTLSLLSLQLASTSWAARPRIGTFRPRTGAALAGRQQISARALTLNMIAAPLVRHLVLGAPGPLIYATKVEARCKILPDGTATTVSVTLENTASNFYGQSLSFKFTPTTSGIPQYLPHPADVYNPVTLAVSPGVYTLDPRNH